MEYIGEIHVARDGAITHTPLPTVAAGLTFPAAASPGPASASAASPSVTPGPCNDSGAHQKRSVTTCRYVPVARIDRPRQMAGRPARPVAGTSTGGAPVVRSRTPRPHGNKPIPAAVGKVVVLAGKETSKAFAGGLALAVVLYLALWWAIPADAFWR